MRRETKRRIIELLAVIALSGLIRGSEINYDTGGSPTAIKFLNHKIIYSTKKQLLIGDFATNKTLEKDKIYVDEFPLMEIPADKPYVFLSGVDKYLLKTNIVGEKGSKQFPLTDIPIKLASSNESLIIGYKNFLQKFDFGKNKLDSGKITFENVKTEIGDFLIVGKYLVIVSKSSSASMLVEIKTLKKLSSFNHKMDDTAKMQKFRGEDQFLIWSSNRKFSLYKIESNGLKVSHLETFEINQKEKELAERDKYVDMIVFKDRDFAVALANNTRRVTILDLKLKMEVRSLKPQIEKKDDILGILSEQGTNLLAVLVKKFNSTHHVIGLSVPEIFDCDSCPFCSSSLKKHCAFCSKKDHFWIDGKCLNCLPTNTMRSESCSSARYMNITSSKDVYYMEDNYFDVIFQNQQGISYELTNETKEWGDDLRVEIDGLDPKNYDYKFKYYLGKLRVIVSLKQRAKTTTLLSKSNEDELLDFFKGKLSVVSNRKKIKISGKDNIYLKNQLAKIEKTQLKNFNWIHVFRDLTATIGEIFNYSSYFWLALALINFLLSLKKGWNLIMPTLTTMIIYKQIYYFRFINSDFGILSSIFLKKFSNSGFQVTVFKSEQILFGSNLAKIDFERMRNLTCQAAILPLSFLFISWIFSVAYSLKFTKYWYRMMRSETNYFQRLSVRKSIWEYMVLKCFVLCLIVQDLFFYLSLDLKLSNFYIGKLNNSKTICIFLSSLFLINRLLFELYTKQIEKRWLSAKNFTQKILNSSMENLYHTGQILQSRLLRHRQGFDCKDIRALQKLKIYSYGIEVSDPMLSPVNFNLVFLCKCLLEIFLIVTLMNTPNMQTLLLFKIEFSFLYQVITSRKWFKSWLTWLKFVTVSLGFLAFALESFFFTKNNNYYNMNLRKHFLVVLLDIVSLVCFLLSAVMAVFEILLRYYLEIRSKKKVDEEMREQKHLDYSMGYLDNLKTGGEEERSPTPPEDKEEEMSTDSLPRMRSRHNTKPAMFIDIKAPQNYSIRSKASRANSRANNSSEEKEIIDETLEGENDLEASQNDFDNSRINLNLSDDNDAEESFQL